MKSWIDIAIGNRPVERHRLSGRRATVGASRRAEISLDGVNGLLAEHFCLTPQIDGCWVELSEQASEPFTFNGRPSRGALIPWEQDIFWGTVRLSVHAETATAKESANSPVMWAALVVIPFAFYSFVYEPESDRVSARSVLDAPPALFGEGTVCSAEGPAALERGRIAEQLAYAKHSRAAFELADAIEAVQLLRESTQCFVAAGREGVAVRTAELGGQWLAELEDTYKRTLLDFELSYRSFSVPSMQRHGNRLTTLLKYGGEVAQPFLQWIDDTIRADQARAIARAMEEAGGQ
jgi:hypothetical protein